MLKKEKAVVPFCAYLQHFSFTMFNTGYIMISPLLPCGKELWNREGKSSGNKFYQKLGINKGNHGI